MKSILTLLIAAGLAASAHSQSAMEPAASGLRVQTSFDLVVRASYAVTAPLFGPNGERAWAGKHWNPAFIYPQPAMDVEGAVFTVNHGALNTIWVNTLFDVEGWHFQYVYFLPNLMVTVIDVRFTPNGRDRTAVHVVYTRTALAPEGNEHVAAMSEGDKLAGKEWQSAIDSYLVKGKTNPEH